jgi:hypothetical protein
MIPQPRAAWKKKYKNWIGFITECEWCGDNFKFFSPLNSDGAPRGRLRFCSRLCIAEARWEKTKKAPGYKVLFDLYVMKQMTETAIGKMFHTSVRVCKKCCAPVHKRHHSRRNKRGERILYGTLCLTHLRAYYSSYEYYRRRKRDLLIGTRKPGGKGIPSVCPKCGTLHPSRRMAVHCCNQRWHKVKSANLHEEQSA